MYSWSAIRELDAIKALYTNDASDPHRLPYSIRDALGDLLIQTNFANLTKPSEQKQFNEHIFKQLGQEPDVKELWTRWTKLPLNSDSSGKARRHSHRTVFETIAKNALQEAALIESNDTGAAAIVTETSVGQVPAEAADYSTSRVQDESYSVEPERNPVPPPPQQPAVSPAPPSSIVSTPKHVSFEEKPSDEEFLNLRLQLREKLLGKPNALGIARQPTRKVVLAQKRNPKSMLEDILKQYV